MNLPGEGDGTRFEPGGNVLGSVYSDVEAYYSARVAKYGATPLGVDWSCQATQSLRFVQLLKICDFSCERDLGCSVETIDNYGMKEFTLLVRCNQTAAD